MLFDNGPERWVWVPGDREREESRDVAKVRVMWGFWGVVDGEGVFWACGGI